MNQYNNIQFFIVNSESYDTKSIHQTDLLFRKKRNLRERVRLNKGYYKNTPMIKEA